MKNLVYLILIALLLGGCAYKNNPVALQPYQSNYNGEVSKEKKTIAIISVKDLRPDKSNIGYALEDGKKEIMFFSNENFVKKYKNGLLNALNIAEFDTTVNPNEADLRIEIYIKKIELIHTDKSFDENLKGEIDIEVVVENGDKIVKQNFKEKAGKWILPSRDSKDLEPFLSSLFSDSINSIVSKLASF